MHTATGGRLALPGRGERGRAATALLAALAAALLLALASAWPGVALAGTTDVGSCHVVDADGNTILDGDGVGPWEAWGWVQGDGEELAKGGAIVMDSDWTLGTRMRVNNGQNITIKMNGHKISRNYEEVGEGCMFWLYANSTLTLDGSDAPDTVFEDIKVYTGWDSTDTSNAYSATGTKTFTAGGLLNGGCSNNTGGAVQVGDNSTLNLINIVIAGNMAYHYNGGAVNMHGEYAVLNMTDSSIEYNSATPDGVNDFGNGGGIHSVGSSQVINMTRSSVNHNVAGQGGGISSRYANLTINMNDHSAIDSNGDIGGGTAFYGGGAIYFNSKDFTVLGDGTASISHNRSNRQKGGAISMAAESGGTIKGITFEGNKAMNYQGGAIFVKSSGVTISQCTFKDNASKDHGGAIFGYAKEMKVIDCTFTGNTTQADGGAIYLDSHDCLVQRCTFTGNKAQGDSSEGGAVYDSGGNSSSGYNTLDGCTITGNYATKDGGGVFLSCDYDLQVAGALQVYGNTRKGDSADDVFLNSNNAGTNGHLRGNVEKGSWIGLRTPASGDYKAVESVTNYIEGSYFMDLPGSFAIQYDSSEHIVYQKAQTGTKYKVTVNNVTVYEGTQGDALGVDCTQDAYAQGRAFWCWDAEQSTGLPGNQDLNTLTHGDLHQPWFTMTLPGNDVHLVAKYVPYLKSASITLEAPEPGEKLPQTALVTYTNSDNVTQTDEFDIAWKQKSGDTYVYATSDTALYDTTYAAQIDISPKYETGLTPGRLSSSNIQVYMSSDEPQTAYDTLGAVDGSLRVTTRSYTTPCKTVADVDDPEGLTVYAGIGAADLAKKMPATVTAKAEDGSTVELKLESAASEDFDWTQSGILNEDGKVKEPAADALTDTRYVQLDVVGGVSESVTVPDELSSVTVEVTVKHPVCTVTVNPANGEGATESAVEWGDTCAVPAAPTLEGNDFLGWYATGSDTAFDFKAPVTGNVELVAKWQVKTLKVYFNAPGAAPARQYVDVKWNTQADQPSVPAMEHYTFDGWYAEGAESAFDFSTPVTGDLTLSAHWTPVTYTVTFDMANGEQVMDVPTAYGAPVSEPEAPERSGFEFLGWFAADGTQWSFDAAVTGDMTLTAHWGVIVPEHFADVEAGSWYEGYVDAAASLGLMTGYQNADGSYTGLFGPKDTLSRGQVATVLWRVAGCPEPEAADHFGADDVDPGAFYATAVNWCCEQGIVTGYKSGSNAGKFVPRNNVSREELATMVYRFAQWAKIETADAPTANFDRCADAGLVSAWAHDASVWCAAAQVMTGKTSEGADGQTVYTLDPQQTAQRREAAKIFVTLYGYYSDRSLEPYEPAQPGESGGDEGTGDEGTAGEASFEDVATFDAVGEDAQVEAAEQPAEAGEQADASFEDVEFGEADQAA